MTTLQKIVSGGQTGVDRAALDAAIECGMSCGGWCPKGRLAEDGPINRHYPLVETPSGDYAERTEWNVRDSDGTLIITWGPPTEGTAFTAGMARKHQKPLVIVDLAAGETLGKAMRWLSGHAIRVLNVAGPRASKCPEIYTLAKDFVAALIDQVPRS